MARHLNKKEKIEKEIGAKLGSTINRAVTRRMIQNRAEHLRGKWFTDKFSRISVGSFEWLEARLQHIIDNELRSHPTMGKTIRLGGK
jgi:hypothetical protein